MPVGTWTQVDPRKHALDGGAQWRNLANMTEPSTCGSNAAIVSNYSDHLFHFFTWQRLTGPISTKTSSQAGTLHSAFFNIMTTTTVLQPFFRDHPGEPVPEECFFWSLWCKER